MTNLTIEKIEKMNTIASGIHAINLNLIDEKKANEILSKNPTTLHFKTLLANYISKEA